MTRRTEFEPLSMTATAGPVSSRPVGDAPPRLRFARDLPDEAAGRGFFERFATARETRIGHEVLVGVERLFARRGLYARRGPVRQDLPALLVVLEIRRHDLAEHLLVHRRNLDRAQGLVAVVVFARLLVGGCV